LGELKPVADAASWLTTLLFVNGLLYNVATDGLVIRAIRWRSRLIL
jgi:hypothetical protein